MLLCIAWTGSNFLCGSQECQSCTKINSYLASTIDGSALQLMNIHNQLVTCKPLITLSLISSIVHLYRMSTIALAFLAMQCYFLAILHISDLKLNVIKYRFWLSFCSALKSAITSCDDKSGHGRTRVWFFILLPSLKFLRYPSNTVFVPYLAGPSP